MAQAAFTTAAFDLKPSQALTQQKQVHPSWPLTHGLVAASIRRAIPPPLEDFAAVKRGLTQQLVHLRNAWELGAGGMYRQVQKISTFY